MTDYTRRERLAAGAYCLALRPAVPRDERRRSFPDMMGFRQKWLHENRTWLYLSCLSPGFRWPLGE